MSSNWVDRSLQTDARDRDGHAGKAGMASSRHREAMPQPRVLQRATASGAWVRSVIFLASLALGVGSAGADWARFGYDAARHNAGPASTGITAANVGRLTRQQVRLPGTVDSSPIYLRGVRVRGGRRDAFFVTTSYGKTLAIAAASGTVLWTFTPRGYGSWAGSERITNSTPIADPGRRFVYAAAPDGRIHKLRVGSGAESHADRWPVVV